MSTGYRHWHTALVVACLGRDLGGTGEQDRPDVAAVVDLLRPYAEEVIALRDQAAVDERPWPFPLPPELAAGLPRAQFGAALHAVRDRLGLLGPTVAPMRGPRPRPTAEELRLMADRPPHWG